MAVVWSEPLSGYKVFWQADRLLRNLFLDKRLLLLCILSYRAQCINLLYHNSMGKKKFIDFIRLAAQPLPKGAEKSFDDGDYNERQTLKRTNADNKAKLSGKSRPKNASTGRKSPRRGSS